MAYLFHFLEETLQNCSGFQKNEMRKKGKEQKNPQTTFVFFKDFLAYIFFRK